MRLLYTPKSLIALHNQFLQQKHFSSLDGVRCFCILAVLWHHSNYPSSSQILTRGFLGVDMFFVLSGFLIVTLLLREQSSTDKISLRKFYARRALRIFPIYYGLLVLLALVYGVLKTSDNNASIFFSTLPFYLTYTSNWSLVQSVGLGVTWSLATEEQFYLIWPAVEKFARKGLVYVVLGLMILINQLINFGVLDNLFEFLYGTPAATQLAILDSTFTPICLGIVLAHLLHQPTSFAWIFRIASHRYAPIVILTILLTVMNFTPSDISGLPRLVIQILMTVWLGSLVVREKHALQPLMTVSPIIRIGKISYGMYLYHPWTFAIVAGITQSLNSHVQLAFPLPVFLIETCLTISIAELSYRFYETPFLKRKSLFSQV